MLVTKKAKTVIHISKWSPTHFASNIRHQHRCSHIFSNQLMFLLIEILMYLICIGYFCFYGCYEMIYNSWRIQSDGQTLALDCIQNSMLNDITYTNSFRIEIHNRKRCYHDSRLHLSVLTFILSFSVQTSAIRNDVDTIISTSVGLGVGTASYFETLQRFFKVFKRQKTEDSI